MGSLLRYQELLACGANLTDPFDFGRCIVNTYREYRHWSPILGSEAARLSMVDEHGSEFYCIVPVRSGHAVDDDGKRVPQYRVDREIALDAIEAAIVARRDPGEVMI